MDVWSREKAKQLLLDGAGKAFAPGLIHLFIDLIPQLVILKEKFPDLSIAQHIYEV